MVGYFRRRVDADMAPDSEKRRKVGHAQVYGICKNKQRDDDVEIFTQVSAELLPGACTCVFC
jgi:hypothetical protein